MKDIFDAITASQNELLDRMTDATAWSPSDRMLAWTAQFQEWGSTAGILQRGISIHMEKLMQSHSERLKETAERTTAFAHQLLEPAKGTTVLDAWNEYLFDAAQRMTLTLDTLRERGDIYLDHEAAGCPPVLAYDYELVLDGADLPRPCNYMLLKILPPEGCEILDWKRPYVIIDPRAGHGAGIGGFKPDSQVGVALRDGHPVYFVAFRRMPEPGQTLAAVTHAEAAFVSKVRELHPDSPLPVVAGNCQGGWAALLLAATNPDLCGPVLLNGAPVQTWAGRVGENPMRYNGGVLGGTANAMLAADLGHGIYDGADIVQNFELLNPSRNYFGKYFDLYSKVDTERERFLEFERWWGGFFLLNEAEMRWIVEQLFVGNRLAKNEARLEPGRPVDIKSIRSPIIAFASRGDNITPPQQALNWILDTYTDEREIAIRGQRIIYMVHEQIGHLGIFVSSKIARREHTHVASTLKTIESLAPGLYEMTIEDFEGPLMERTFTVSFHERKMTDIAAFDDGRDDEIPFAAVARHSEQQAEAYDVLLRPFVQAMVTEEGADLRRKMHPMRLQRGLFSSRNPLVAPLKEAAGRATRERKPARADNPFLLGETIFAGMVEQSLDLWRDWRDMGHEATFYGLWGTPVARWFGRTHQPGRTLKTEEELLSLPAVRAALHHLEEGGFAEAVIRMLILLADSRGNVRSDRLERASRILTQNEPFRSIPADTRALILNEQKLIVEFAPQAAMSSLARLLKTPEERRLAVLVVQYVPGPRAEMTEHTRAVIDRFIEVLELDMTPGDVLDDPLDEAGAPPAVSRAPVARRIRSAPAHSL
ncbi:DUF3141 domain-containing protein [Roseibium aestuarii]|uniref:DUF3141 domain-containing protein n=1 Tax=Roseibium aestuarii TaxID=2600299 RepID=A0ABW4JSI0_9HYPH|nr:DUF3141 domain-containing protein [Roseibium aestuarii]